MGSRYAAPAALEVLAASNSFISASQSTEIPNVNHYNWPTVRHPCFSPANHLFHPPASLQLQTSPPPLLIMLHRFIMEAPKRLPCPPRLQHLTNDGVSLCHPGCNAVVPPRLTATSASQVEAILLPQSPKGGLILLPRLECDGTTVAHCSLELRGSSSPPFSDS
ncbi:hypothetical protein AAY473_001570 [Plecturocebus cupreus]